MSCARRSLRRPDSLEHEVVSYQVGIENQSRCFARGASVNCWVTFLVCLVSEIGSHYVGLVNLELTM